MAESHQAYSEGQAVRFTVGPLGALYAPEIVVNAGEEGTYRRPVHDTKGWHVINVAREDAIYLVPVSEDQFEVLDA